MKCKKILAISLSVLMALPLVACGGSKSSNEPSAVDEVLAGVGSGEGTYKEVKEVTFDGIGSIEKTFRGADGRVYVVSTEIEISEPEVFEAEEPEEVSEEIDESIEADAEEVAAETEEADEASLDESAEEAEPAEETDIIDEATDESTSQLLIHFASFDSKGDDVSAVSTVSVPNAESVGAMAVDKDGNVYFTTIKWESDGVDSLLYKCDKSGNLQASADIKSNGSESFGGGNYIVVDEAGHLCLVDSSSLYFYDAASLTQKGGKSLNDSYISGACTDKEGNTIIVYQDAVNYKPVINTLDYNSATLTQISENVVEDFYGIEASSNWDFMALGSGSLYGYDKATDSFSVIFDAYSSNIAPSSLSTVIATDENTAIVALYDDNYDKSIMVYEKVDPSAIANKKIITLGCYYLDSEVSKKVIEFNKKSDTAKIVIVSYDKYNSLTDSSKGFKMLQNDIAANKCPDIICLPSSQLSQLNKYANKGVFTDIGKLIDEDPELSRDDFLPNILEIGTVDNKLVYLAPGFWLSSWGMKESLYNAVGGDISIDNIDAIEAQVSDRAFESSSNTSLMATGISYNMQDFLEVKSGKCSFDSDEFKELLDYAATYPDEAVYDNDFSNDNILNNKNAFQPVYFSQLTELNRTEKSVFGENMVCTGFPSTVSGNGGAFVTLDSVYAISDKSDAKDEVWEFIRPLFLEDYQTSEDRYYVPSTWAGLNANAQRAMKNPVEVNPETGKEEEVTQYYYVNEKEYVLEPMTKERADYFINYITSVTNVYMYNEDITAIISEETAPFFAGDKSADEVTKVIQSRINIYVKENQ